MSCSGRHFGGKTLMTWKQGVDALPEQSCERSSRGRCGGWRAARPPDPSMMFVFQLVLEVVLSGPLVPMKSTDERVLRSNHG